MGIREKSGWVCDRKSPKTEERVMNSSGGQGGGSKIPAEEGRVRLCCDPEHGEWSWFSLFLSQVAAENGWRRDFFSITHTLGGLRGEKLSAQRDGMI